MPISIEHNLEDHELIDILEKSLRKLRTKSLVPKELEDAILNRLAEAWKTIFQVQTGMMLNRIERVLSSDNSQASQ